MQDPKPKESPRTATSNLEGYDPMGAMSRHVDRRATRTASSATYASAIQSERSSKEQTVPVGNDGPVISRRRVLEAAGTIATVAGIPAAYFAAQGLNQLARKVMGSDEEEEDKVRTINNEVNNQGNSR